MSNAPSRGSRATLAGLALAGTGLLHFARPAVFEPITKPAFPERTRAHVYTNGGIETLLGLGLVSPKTRKLALAGGVGYLAYLGFNGVRNVGR